MGGEGVRFRFAGIKAGFALIILAFLGPSMSFADICTMDMWDNGSTRPGMIFPNWQRVKVASADVLLCLGCTWRLDERINGITVVNFGTATQADLKAVYWQAGCGATTTGLQTLTFAGTYTEDTGNYPAWTWSGSSADLAGCPPMYIGGPASFTVNLYADVAPCPTPGANIRMGFPIHSATSTTWWGSLRDNAGCAVPWGDINGPSFTIAYVYKEADAERAAPGDTVDFTVYYARPGTLDLTGVEIIDTQPPYTHYVNGSGNPPPDPGWDPDPGPPLRLKWTVPPPHPVTGGPTGLVTFSLSVDWGNTEGFEPGSGDVAAPEGARLNNQAQVFFRDTDCGVTSAVNPPVTTVVRRFLFWMLGDNDVLFSTVPGTSADEMIYEIYVKNTSATKTWWDVHIWDTVPPELDFWGPGCGLEDPCVGWTQTPWGCPSAGPGKVVTGSTTLLTWRLDMHPNATLMLRWKARVNSTAPAFSTAVNILSMLEYGRISIVGGTGHSGAPAKFAHIAPLILPTTYVSYVARTALCNFKCAAGTGFFLPFFPLNKKTQFELRGIEYIDTISVLPVNGGVSQSIGCLIGDCIGGFPGNSGCSLGSGAISGGGTAGCRAERIPAIYEPTLYKTSTYCASTPFVFLYKITSNSPVLWQISDYVGGECTVDNHTYAPASTLNYTGMIHYMWKRENPGCPEGYGDSITLINTAKDPYDSVQPNLPTTVHMFSFDFPSSSWVHRKIFELDHESLSMDLGTVATDAIPWRTVSSDANLIVNQGMNIFDGSKGIGDSFAAFAPTRETGNTVSKVGAGTFYGLIRAESELRKAVLGNTGAAAATCRLWRYVPDNTSADPLIPANLTGNSGHWVTMGNLVVPAGLAAAANPLWFDDNGNTFVQSSLAAYKLEVLSGGPVQLYHGSDVYSGVSGGSVVHAADGEQTGTEFWMNLVTGSVKCSSTGDPQVHTFTLFCPRQGMAFQAVSETGYTARYTTSGPDQAIVFLKFTNPADGVKVNYRFNQVGLSGNAIGQFVASAVVSKMFTAPFLSTGVHYRLILPPVVYSGQSFWMTVIVMDTGGATKMDYDGVTSFTSTEPKAEIEAKAMAGYDYQWIPATDQGLRIFINVRLFQLGQQTIVASDTLDGSITGLGTTLVVGADVKLSKQPQLSILSSGETIQFRVCWSNYSSATATGFVITDAVPMGTTYVPEAASLMSCGAGGLATPTVTVAYGTASPTTPAIFNTLTSPTQTAPANTRWLRWTIQDVYVYSTGCVCFRARVD